MFVSVFCITQIALLLALTTRDVWTRRRQIVHVLQHRGWVMSTRGLPPMQREPVFADDGGAIVYLLPERREVLMTASLQHAA
ncbi:hypothetical protein [Polymorphobacter arshaanensis]|nr:hypothetical protein [Polymorphobacter arshaanensis]